jgi:hypothetical protein
VFLFVGAWMAAGWIFRLDANQYLLLGVPLTMIFHVGFRRQPLLSLWVRSAPPLRIDGTWLFWTAVFAAVPAWDLWRTGLQGGWVIAAWSLCAVLGAAGAAYSIQHADRRVRRGVKPSLMMVAIIGALMLMIALSQKGLSAFRWQALSEFALWSALYFPVCFLLEEVTFRGVLDNYVYRPEDKGGKASAVVLSFLWGLWHLPLIPFGDNVLAMVLLPIQVGIWHTLVGVPLTMSWRIGGSLLVPAAAHAVLNGIRNAVVLTN